MGSSTSPDTQHPTTKESADQLGWTDAQIKVLQKLGGCSERNPSTRANDEGTHSDVSTPKHRIKIDDEQLLKAPYRGITTPMKNPNFLYQKVWNPVIDWNEWDVPWDRVSGYMFDQGTVWLYTRHDHELFIENHTPHIQFHAEDWAYFRNVVKSKGRSRRHTGSLLTHFICLALSLLPMKRMEKHCIIKLHARRNPSPAC